MLNTSLRTGVSLAVCSNRYSTLKLFKVRHWVLRVSHQIPLFNEAKCKEHSVGRADGSRRWTSYRILIDDVVVVKVEADHCFIWIESK